MSQTVVAALYKFTRFDAPEALRAPLAKLCCAQGVKGTILLAREGINGTIAGPRASIDAVLAHLRDLPGLADLEVKESAADEPPFRRMKVRLKKEIVTIGAADVDPTVQVGEYVTPQDWNALISQGDVAVIDTRNAYEVGLGSFEGAVDPETEAFGDFPDWWRAHKDEYAGKRIAMFCTGGIRCEKASSFLVGEGVDEVFHLKGGVLKYLEEVPSQDSLWHGECYVFDRRVSVGHGLIPGDNMLCHACGRPVTPQDRAAPEYEPGVSCPACIDEYDDTRRARFRERQLDLAARRRA